MTVREGEVSSPSLITVLTHPNYTQPDDLRRFFVYEHLPDYLQETSKLFADLAEAIDLNSNSDNPEKKMALRKLLEAKDCAVRAAVLEKAEE